MGKSKTKILIFIFCILNFAGCTTLEDIPKGFVGVSTRVLEEGRKQAITKQFNYDYDTCYKRIKEILARLKTYIYAENKKKNMIAIYLSEQDTTPVGIFFKAVDEKNTQVGVSSPSTYAKEYISTKLFGALGRNDVK